MRSPVVFCLFAALLAAAATPVRADEDAVQFFRNIDVTPDVPVHDAVCFFCNVNVKGNVQGDIVAFFGNVRLDGQAHHDVVNFFGHVAAADNSSIGGDLVSFFGGVRLGQNVTVAKDMVTVFGIVHAPGSVAVGGDRVGLSPLIALAPLLVIFFVVFLIVTAFRDRRMRQFAQNYPFPPRP